MILIHHMQLADIDNIADCHAKFVPDGEGVPYIWTLPDWVSLLYGTVTEDSQ